jgi:hypothetical protein
MLTEFVVQGCPHDHFNENRSSAPEDAGWSNVPAHTTADDPPQAVWQKIVSAIPQKFMLAVYMNATQNRYSFAHLFLCTF